MTRSNNFSEGVRGSRDDEAGLAAAERALERLFRLAMGRKLHTRQSVAVGAVVTRAGYAILRSLDEEGELTMGQLAHLTAMDPAAAGRQVKGLEGDALVERSAASGDARSTVVRLSARGREVYRRVVAVRTAHMEQVLAHWPAADRSDLARLVDRLVDDLRAVPFRPGP